MGWEIGGLELAGESMPLKDEATRGSMRTRGRDGRLGFKGGAFFGMMATLYQGSKKVLGERVAFGKLRRFAVAFFGVLVVLMKRGNVCLFCFFFLWGLSGGFMDKNSVETAWCTTWWMAPFGAASDSRVDTKTTRQPCTWHRHEPQPSVE